MFWGDSRLGRLETSRLDGSSRRVIYDHVGDRYYSIAVSPRYLYVTDWTERYDQRLQSHVAIIIRVSIIRSYIYRLSSYSSISLVNLVRYI